MIPPPIAAIKSLMDNQDTKPHWLLIAEIIFLSLVLAYIGIDLIVNWR